MAGAVVNSPDGAEVSNTGGNSESTASTAECDVRVEPGTPVPPSRPDEGSQDSKSVVQRRPEKKWEGRLRQRPRELGRGQPELREWEM